jgi:type I restriction enzyme M protein
MAAAKKEGLKLPAPIIKAILSALSERDETAVICRDLDGNAEPDPDLRDTESVPLSEGVEAFFEREVKPHVPDAWTEISKRDEKNHQVGIVGYEVNFNRYFYKYTPPRPLEDIEADIRAIEGSRPLRAHRSHAPDAMGGSALSGDARSRFPAPGRRHRRGDPDGC